MSMITFNLYSFDPRIYHIYNGIAWIVDLPYNWKSHPAAKNHVHDCRM